MSQGKAAAPPRIFPTLTDEVLKEGFNPMVNSISSAQQPQPVSSQSARQSPPAAASKSEAPKDSVYLSAAAQKAISGDVDHDGDSH
jgi:hypothetical protein